MLLHLGPLVLPTFGALLASGLMLALALSLRTAPLAGLSEDKLWNAGLFAVVAAFAISRMLLVAANWRSFRLAPLLVLAMPSLTPAGLLLALAATLLWLWGRQVPIGLALEAWTPPGLLLWGFLALGHFAEGSDPGLPTNAPWGVRFPGTAFHQQPVALFAAVAAFALAVWMGARLRRHEPAFGLGLFWAGAAQMLLGFVRQPAPDTVAGLDALQWLGAGLALCGGFLFALNGRRRKI